MKNLYALSIIFAVCVCASAQSSRVKTALARIDDSAAILKTFSDMGGQTFPMELMRAAKAVAVFPDVGQKSSFLYRTSDGRGILIRRDADGAWGLPTYLRVNAIRPEFTPTPLWRNSKIDLVFLFMDDRGMDLIRGYRKDQEKVIDEKLAIGPVVKGKGADETLKNAWVLYYAFEDGKLSGQEFHNNKFSSAVLLRQDDDNTKAIYTRSFKDLQKLGMPADGLPAEALNIQRFMNTAFGEGK